MPLFSLLAFFLCLPSFAQANSTTPQLILKELAVRKAIQDDVLAQKHVEDLRARAMDTVPGSGRHEGAGFSELRRYEFAEMETTVEQSKDAVKEAQTQLTNVLRMNPVALAPLYKEGAFPVFDFDLFTDQRRPSNPVKPTDIFFKHPMSLQLVDSASKLNSPLDLFLNEDLRVLSPVSRVDRAQILFDSIESFQAKFEALMGYQLPLEAFEKHDPSYRLDYSKAPALDEIYLYTFYFANDFSGTLIKNALVYHASRGAKVRVMVPEAILRAERAFLPELSGPNQAIVNELRAQGVEVDEWADTRTFVKENIEISRLYRVAHAKFLVTTSKTQPQANVVITGGRNIGDVYTLRKAPDMSPYPDKLQHQRGTFDIPADIDVLVKGGEFARQMAAQLKAVWFREDLTMHYSEPWLYADLPELLRGITGPLKKTLREGTFARGFFHIARDFQESQITTLYIDMIKSAKKKIILTIPYLHPDPKIRKALINALVNASQRLKVELIVNLDIIDNMGIGGLDMKVYRAAAAELLEIKNSLNLEGLKILSWNRKDLYLHAKTINIDDEVVLISSVNLNRRSFLHDTEGGVLLTGKDVVQSYNKILDEQIRPSLRVVDKVENTMSGWDKFLYWLIKGNL